MPQDGVSLVITKTRDEAAAMPEVLRVKPGRVTELVGDFGSGLTRLGLSFLAEHSLLAPVVALDVRGWLSPPAAWEVGVRPDRLVVVRCPERRVWPQVAAALLEGVKAVYAEVPTGVGDHDLRRLGALARARGALVVLRPLGGALPSGVSYLRLRARGATWEGTEEGHGRLKRRHLSLEATGKGVFGMSQLLEVEDSGADFVCVVPGLAVGSSRRPIIG